MRLMIVFLFSVLVVNVARAQGTEGSPDRRDSFVATSRSFAFYSDSRTNLHDFLVWNARTPELVDPELDCRAALSSDQRSAFDRAQDYYADTFSSGSGERLLLALRYRLAGFGDFELAEPTAITAVLSMLQAALPAYESCWWQEHDVRNTSWVAELLPLLVAHEDAVHERLAGLYGKELARPLQVDVVGYAGFGGASSVTDPDHLLVSSAHPSNAGYAGLEIVFHEASHTVFGPRVGGQLWDALQRASSSADVVPPRDLWHALLFYTTGNAVTTLLAEHGVADYQPYAYSEGLFDRAWPALRGPLEQEWQPYLDGNLPLTEAMKRLVEALREQDQN